MLMKLGMGVTIIKSKGGLFQVPQKMCALGYFAMCKSPMPLNRPVFYSKSELNPNFCYIVNAAEASAQHCKNAHIISRSDYGCKHIQFVTKVSENM